MPSAGRLALAMGKRVWGGAGSGAGSGERRRERKRMDRLDKMLYKMDYFNHAVFGQAKQKRGGGSRSGGNSISWNDMFQTALDMPEGSEEEAVDKYLLLARVTEDFVAVAKAYGKIIISEHKLVPELQTIPPDPHFGGVAGGTKYVSHGILFKLTRDPPQNPHDEAGKHGKKGPFIYGKDIEMYELAAKAAGHDLKGAQAYFQCATSVGNSIGESPSSSSSLKSSSSSSASSSSSSFSTASAAASSSAAKPPPLSPSKRPHHVYVSPYQRSQSSSSLTEETKQSARPQVNRLVTGDDESYQDDPLDDDVPPQSPPINHSASLNQSGSHGYAAASPPPPSSSSPLQTPTTPCSPPLVGAEADEDLEDGETREEDGSDRYFSSLAARVDVWCYLRGTGRRWKGKVFAARIVEVRRQDRSVKVRYEDGGYKRFAEKDFRLYETDAPPVAENSEEEEQKWREGGVGGGYRVSVDHRVPRVPMLCTIDYHGFRLLAMPLLRLRRPSSICYGSDDGGRTIHHGLEAAQEERQGDEKGVTESSDMSVRGVMLKLAEKLHLAEHFVFGSTLAGAGDIECHHGTDRRIYLLDMARTFPPEAPNACSHLKPWGQPEFFRLLRNELLQLLRREGMPPLSPDALTNWSRGQPDRETQNRKVFQATRFLVNTLIPRFAEELDSVAAWDSSRQPLQLGKAVSHNMHKRGFNIRHIGLLRSLVVVNQYARTVLLVECVSRTLKNILRGWLRATMRRSSMRNGKFQVSLSCAIVTEFINIVVGSSNESEYFWNQDLLPNVLQRFGAKALDEAEKGDLFRSSTRDHLLWIVVYALQMAGWQLTEACHAECVSADKGGGLFGFEFTTADLKEPSVRVKHMSIQDYAKGRVLAQLGERQFDSNPKAALRLVALAGVAFRNALRSDPLNSTSLASAFRAQIYSEELQGRFAAAERIALVEAKSAFREKMPAVAEPLMFQLLEMWAKRRSKGLFVHFAGAASIGALLTITNFCNSPLTRFSRRVKALATTALAIHKTALARALQYLYRSLQKTLKEEEKESDRVWPPLKWRRKEGLVGGGGQGVEVDAEEVEEEQGEEEQKQRNSAAIVETDSTEEVLDVCFRVQPNSIVMRTCMQKVSTFHDEKELNSSGHSHTGLSTQAGGVDQGMGSSRAWVNNHSASPCLHRKELRRPKLKAPHSVLNKREVQSMSLLRRMSSRRHSSLHGSSLHDAVAVRGPVGETGEMEMAIDVGKKDLQSSNWLPPRVPMLFIVHTHMRNRRRRKAFGEASWRNKPLSLTRAARRKRAAEGREGRDLVKPWGLPPRIPATYRQILGLLQQDLQAKRQQRAGWGEAGGPYGLSDVPTAFALQRYYHACLQAADEGKVGSVALLAGVPGIGLKPLLYLACAWNRSNAVSTLLTMTGMPGLQWRDVQGWTPLLQAAGMGHWQCVATCLAFMGKQMEEAQRARKGMALHHRGGATPPAAAGGGSRVQGGLLGVRQVSDACLEVVDAVTREKEEDNGFGGRTETALLLACRLGYHRVVRVLLAGCEANILTFQSTSSLSSSKQNKSHHPRGHACARASKRCVWPMSDTEAVNAQGQTALMAAVCGGHVAVVRELLRPRPCHVDHKAARLQQRLARQDVLQGRLPPPHTTTPPRLSHKSATLLPISRSLSSSLSLSSSSTSSSASSPPLSASASWPQAQAALASQRPSSLPVLHDCHVRVAGRLQDRVNVEAMDADRNSLLNICAVEGKPRIARLLLQAKANIHSVNKYEDSPLQTAAAHGHTEVLRVLLDWKAAPNVTGRYNTTPLMRAAFGGHVSCVEVLLSRGGHKFAVDKYSSGVLWWASFGGNGDLVRQWLEYHAKEDKVKIALETPNKNGGTCLSVAVDRGHVEIVSLLLKQGAFTESQDKLGDTPLLAAMQILSGRPTTTELLVDKKIDGSGGSKRRRPGWQRLKRVNSRLCRTIPGARHGLLRLQACLTDAPPSSPSTSGPHIPTLSRSLTYRQRYVEIALELLRAGADPFRRDEGRGVRDERGREVADPSTGFHCAHFATLAGCAPILDSMCSTVHNRSKGRGSGSGGGNQEVDLWQFLLAAESEGACSVFRLACLDADRAEKVKRGIEVVEEEERKEVEEEDGDEQEVEANAKEEGYENEQEEEDDEQGSVLAVLSKWLPEAAGARKGGFEALLRELELLEKHLPIVFPHSLSPASADSGGSCVATQGTGQTPSSTTLPASSTSISINSSTSTSSSSRQAVQARQPMPQSRLLTGGEQRVRRAVRIVRSALLRRMSRP